MKFTNIMVNQPILFNTILIIILVATLLILTILLYFKLKADRAMTRATKELKMITESISAGIVNFILDDRLTIAYANTVFYQILQYDKTEALNNNKIYLLEFIIEKDRREIIEYFKDIIKTKKDKIKFETKMISRDNQKIDVIITGVISYKMGIQASATILEITDIKSMKRQLLIDKERYEISTQLSNSVAFEYDIKEDRAVFSDKFYDIFGRSTVIENYSKNLGEKALIVHSDDIGLLYSFFNSVENSKEIASQELRILGKYDEYLCCQLSAKMIFVEDEPTKVIGKITDISTYKNALSELEFKATRDPLTLIYNKEAIKTKIEKFISVNRQKKHLIMFVDFDDFKLINDKYGHLVGDKVLIEITRMLKKSFDGDEMIGRIGGDEFIVFIGNIQNEKELIDKANSLINKFNKVHRIDNQDIPISVSIGISICPDDGNTYEILLEHADKALYIAKARGKKNYHIYNKQTD